MGGILPDQPGGASLDFGLLGDLFGVSAGGEIPLLSSLTQPFIEGVLKDREIKNSPGWLGAAEAAFSGLLSGIPLVPNILMTLANAIIGLPFSIWPGTGPGGFLGEVPNIISDIGNFFFNLTGFFGGGVDFNDLLFDIPAAVFNFVDTMLIPTDLIAQLIGGFIPGFQIPGLDASKIISGQFPLEMISGLLDTGGKILTGLLSVPTSVITGLLSGGTILTSLIPGLDASKIISGSFPLSMITGLLDGGGKVLTSLLSVPTSVITGLFGGGGSILTSLIPGLDASKIISGTFGLSMISGLLDGGGKVLTSLLSVPTSVITGLFSGSSILTSWIPGLDASKIISGTFGQSMITNLIPDLSNLSDGIQGVIDNIISVIRKVPFVGGTLANLFDDLTDWFGFTEDTDTTLVETRETLVTNITGNTAVDPTTSDVADAVAGQTDTVASTAAAVAALAQTQTGQTNSGNSAIELFEYLDLDSLDPALWSRIVLLGTNGTNGTIAVADGHNAGMVAGSTSADYREFNRYKGPNNHTQTPYQRIGITIAVAMSSPGFLDSRNPAIDIYGRASDDETKWARFTWFRNGTVRFEYKNGGAITQLGTDTTGAGNPAVGANLWMDCGTSGGINVYRLYNGTKIIKTVTDSGHVIDETQLGGGWGQRNHNNLLPGKIAQWSMADNSPATILGTTFRAYRTTVAGITKASGDGVLPANTFDAVDYISNDLTWDAANSKLTASRAGTYLVAARLSMTRIIGQSEEWITSLYKNGSLYSYGEGYKGWQGTATSNDNENTVYSVGGGIQSVYLVPGDYIQFGAWNGSSVPIAGRADGQITWCNAVRVGS